MLLAMLLVLFPAPTAAVAAEGIWLPMGLPIAEWLLGVLLLGGPIGK
jgi:hypothetical protein